ncbi:MAG: MlaD family protein [Mariprofundaceae bacterium]
MVKHEDFVSSMRRQVGWFVMLGIGVLLLLLLVISIRTNIFSKQFYVYFFPPSAEAFYEGQPVKFQGFSIGHIDKIELEEEGKVKITLELLERYRHMIHKSSVAKVIKEGLIGEQGVEVTAGDEKKPAIHEGDILGYESEASFEQLLIDLKPAVSNANVLLGEMASLAVWMNDPNGDVRVVMAGLRDVTEDIGGGKLEKMLEQLTGMLEHLQKFAGEMNQQHVAKELSNSLKMMAKILSDLEPFSEAMGEKGTATVEHMNSLLNNVDQLSKSLNIVASDLSELTPELPGLARESRATIEEIKSLIKNLQGSWLVGGDKHKSKDGDAVVAPPALDMRP